MRWFLFFFSFSLSSCEKICGELTLTLPRETKSTAKSLLERREMCLSHIPLTFDTCKRLLQISSKCNALLYSNARCTIYDRFSEVKHPGNSSHHGPHHAGGESVSFLHYILNTERDDCIPEEKSNIGDPMSQCLTDSSSENAKKSPTLETWLSLPPLGIVMAVTQDWIKKNQFELKSVSSNWECYSRAHNYSFHLHIMEDMSRDRFFHERHVSIVQNYLHLYRYLLVIDADNLVLNMSKSLDHLISATSPSSSSSESLPDLYFHMREGGEVTASTYLLKNSLFGRCFMDFWRSISPESSLQYPHWIPSPNHDNGDLVIALMTLINRTALLNCSSYIRSHLGVDSYDSGELLCFRLFRGVLLHPINSLSNIRIFFIRESFFRMHLGHPTSAMTPSPSQSPSLFRQISRGSTESESQSLQYLRKDVFCHQNDLIGHGWKQIGTYFWPSNSVSTCNLSAIQTGGGGNSVCQWLSVEEEREIVIKKCYWRSPLCLLSNSSSNGLESKKDGDNHRNICLESEFCDGEKFNLQRWSLCVTHGICNPYLTMRQFQRHHSHLQLDRPWID